MSRPPKPKPDNTTTVDRCPFCDASIAHQEQLQGVYDGALINHGTCGHAWPRWNGSAGTTGGHLQSLALQELERREQQRRSIGR